MTFLMSIKPEYAQLILARKKTVEIRRKRLHADKGDMVMVYATAPIKKILGYFIVEDIEYGSTMQIWETCGKDSCLAYENYYMYVRNANEVCAIHLRDAVITKTIDLSILRDDYHIHIPQSYMRLEDTLAQEIHRRML